MQPINFNAISFIESGKLEKGYFFYNSNHDSNENNFFSVKDLTLPKAIDILKAKGIDVIKNLKINIKVYYKF